MNNLGNCKLNRIFLFWDLDEGEWIDNVKKFCRQTHELTFADGHKEERNFIIYDILGDDYFEEALNSPNARIFSWPNLATKSSQPSCQNPKNY